MTLKEIAIELLEKYEASENVAICEYSTNINKDMDLIDEEVKKYRRMIEDADRKTEPQTEEWHDDCNTCRWHDGACTIPCCDYEPKTEPQTDCSWK